MKMGSDADYGIMMEKNYSDLVSRYLERITQLPLSVQFPAEISMRRC